MRRLSSLFRLPSAIALCALLAAGPAPAFVLVNPARFVGGVPSGTWYDLTAFAGTDASEDLGDDAYLVWFPWTAPAGGNLTKFRFKVGAYTANTDVKVGIYNIGGSLLVSGSTTATGTGTFEMSVTSTAITNGSSYFVAIIGNNYPGGIQIAYKAGTGTFYYGDGSVGFYTMPSTLPSSSGSDSKTYAIGMFLE